MTMYRLNSHFPGLSSYWSPTNGIKVLKELKTSNWNIPDSTLMCIIFVDCVGT